jgi:hypothetical protein
VGYPKDATFLAGVHPVGYTAVLTRPSAQTALLSRISFRFEHLKLPDTSANAKEVEKFA